MFAEESDKAENLKFLRYFNVHSGAVNDVVVLEGSLFKDKCMRIVSCSIDSTIRISNLETNEVKILKTRQYSRKLVRLSKNLIVTGDVERCILFIRIWGDKCIFQPIRFYTAISGIMSICKISDIAGHFLIGDFRGRLVRVEYEEGSSGDEYPVSLKSLKTFKRGHSTCVQKIYKLKSKNNVISSAYNNSKNIKEKKCGSVIMWNIDDVSIIQLFKEKCEVFDISSFFHSSSGDEKVMLCCKENIEVYNLKGNQLFSFPIFHYFCSLFVLEEKPFPTVIAGTVEGCLLFLEIEIDGSLKYSKRYRKRLGKDFEDYHFHQDWVNVRRLDDSRILTFSADGSIKFWCFEQRNIDDLDLDQPDFESGGNGQKIVDEIIRIESEIQSLKDRKRFENLEELKRIDKRLDNWLCDIDYEIKIKNDLKKKNNVVI